MDGTKVRVVGQCSHALPKEGAQSAGKIRTEAEGECRRNVGGIKRVKREVDEEK
jgi:hypothetical protein